MLMNTITATDKITIENKNISILERDASVCTFIYEDGSDLTATIELSGTATLTVTTTLNVTVQAASGYTLNTTVNDDGTTTYSVTENVS
jgi:hypothetical protein